MIAVMQTRAASPLYTTPHKLWRGLPPAFRRQALARATSLLAPRPRPCRATAGLAVAGELSRASGLGETARLMARAAERAGLEVWPIDLPPPVDATREIPAGPNLVPPPGVPLVLHVNAPTLPLALLRLPQAATRGRPIVGYWAWEMPDIPPEWHPALRCVSRVWVPSRFTASALERHLPGRVHVVPPAISLAPPIPSGKSRNDFGLPADAVVVLVSFNLASSLARKHPFGAIAAFRGAFGDRADRILVLKISHPEHAPGDFQHLAQMAQAPNIRIDTRTYTSADTHALTACADIVLSLHRGEGFGLVLAEAMALGKPVVATAWSGNTDFMDASNSMPVRYRLAPARDDRAVYRGLWAEPNVAEAADILRALADDPGRRKTLGDKARCSINARLTGRELIPALEALR